MKNKILIGFILASVLIAILPMCLAATSMVLPKAGTNHSTTIEIQASYVNATDIAGVAAANCTCYHNATGTWTAFTDTITVNEKATTGSNITMTGTLTSALDDTDVSVNCSIGNETAIIGVSPVVVNAFDSTAPTLHFLVPLSSDSESYGVAVEYKCNPSDTIDSSLTTTFTVTHPSGDTTTSTSLTYGTSTLQRFTDTDFAGDYVFTCSSTDYTGNSASESATVTIDSLGKITKIKSNGKGLLQDNMIWIIAIVIIGILIWSSRNK